MEQQKDVNLKAVLSQIIDVERLIELVKERPVIWDKTVEGYRNRDVSLPAWQDIYRIMFDNYDVLHVDQKKFIGKVIKQKWTTARDIWQRSHKKRKETAERGENINDFKDNARYEKLIFLAKVYDRDDHFQSDKEDNMSDPKMGNIGRPLSPQDDFGGENIPILNNADFQCDLLKVLKIPGGPKNHDLSLSHKKRKLQHGSGTNAVVNNEQGTSSQKPMVVNVEDRIIVGNLINANKRRMSSVDSKDTDKSTYNQIQSPKREQAYTNPMREDVTSVENSQLIKNSSEQISQKLLSRSPCQYVNKENFPSPSICNDKKTKLQLLDKNGPKLDVNYEKKIEQTSNKSPSKAKSSENNELAQFFQVLKTSTEDFNKAQMMDFFFEILKPRIKDFDKHQLLDFQIEALQLVKKIQGYQ